MPAGSRPASGRGIGANGLGTPALSSNLNNGGGVNGSGVLARNLSPEKQRRGDNKGRGSRGSPTAAVGDGDVEMVKAGRAGAGLSGGYTPQSMASSSEAFDVEDANQRIAPPKVNLRA